jgi:Tol biopolymer transport system component
VFFASPTWNGTGESFIDVVRPDGTGARTLVDGRRGRADYRKEPWAAGWSPDGSALAFYTHEDCEGAWCALNVIKPDRTGRRQIAEFDTRWKGIHIPSPAAWSRDGNYIAGVLCVEGECEQGPPTCEDGENWLDLHVVDVDSGHIRQIADLPIGENPRGISWSAGDRFIAFGEDWWSCPPHNVWVIRPDGTGLKSVAMSESTTSPRFPGSP